MNPDTWQRPPPRFSQDPGLNPEKIKKVQKHLRDACYDPGDIDGVIGPATRYAVTEFQRSAGLPPDGDMTDAFFVALERAAAVRRDCKYTPCEALQRHKVWIEKDARAAKKKQFQVYSEGIKDFEGIKKELENRGLWVTSNWAEIAAYLGVVSDKTTKLIIGLSAFAPGAQPAAATAGTLYCASRSRGKALRRMLELESNEHTPKHVSKIYRDEAGAVLACGLQHSSGSKRSKAKKTTLSHMLKVLRGQVDSLRKLAVMPAEIEAARQTLNEQIARIDEQLKFNKEKLEEIKLADELHALWRQLQEKVCVGPSKVP